MHLLEAPGPVALQVITFVGNFEANPFVVPQEDLTFLALPIEVPLELYQILLPHELTHVVHHSFGKLTPSWERSIAQVVLEEGLATRVSQQLFPGQPETRYIEMQQSPGWLARCREQSAEIFAGILPFLSEDQSEVVFQFTMGQGTTALEREAYFVGWELVGRLLQDGRSFAELARIPAEDLPRFVRTHLQKLL
ncbi:hypothetical protein GCM10008938_44640 [Deinococcus roseus]|uniref:DUF2268 domain-containing protein n=2 Tax=Deinococcus roseus TaxID=392414 RepID=A0ABQ2DD44_9DEIO|nr:hypothetical protein GCM10008938_44640 [Deinococcus roseus]